jgi:3-phenylpropionate/trans-cinnamate dioxygenase ferredoxin component
VTDSGSVRVAGAADLAPGTMLLVPVDGEPVLLVNLEGTIHALQGVCSHEEYELDQGFQYGDTLTCSLHGSRFNLVSGEALDPPAELPLVRYPVHLADDAIWIDLPAAGARVNSDLR